MSSRLAKNSVEFIFGYKVPNTSLIVIKAYGEH